MRVLSASDPDSTLDKLVLDTRTFHFPLSTFNLEMVRVTCYIRPHKLEAVKSAISSIGISGMTVTDVRGTGNSIETSTWFGGEQQLIALPIRSKIEVVAKDDLQDEIVNAIIESARTGEPGDGKIFVERAIEAIRIRTLERSDEAI